jgi:hypothetical protein
LKAEELEAAEEAKQGGTVGESFPATNPLALTSASPRA